MTVNNLSCLKQISSYLQIPINKINLNNDKMPTCTFKNKSITGFVNIILTLLKEKSLVFNSDLEEAEIRQWLEFCVIYAQNSARILQELDTVLATRTYFVGNNLSVADVALFYTLQHLMQKFTYLEKEKYLNISRWYDNVQQNDSVRKDNPVIDFSTVFLSCMS